MEIKLHQTFEVSGTSLEEFFEAIASMDAATNVQQVESEELQMLAIANAYDDAQEMALMETSGMSEPLKETITRHLNTIHRAQDQEKVPVVHFSPRKKPSYCTLTNGYFYLNDITDELFYELQTDSKMLIIHNDKPYAVSPLAFSTLLRRAGISGEAFMHPRVGRVLEIFKMLHFFNPQTVTVVTRRNKSAAIVLAVHAKTYTHIPQTILKTVYEEICSSLGTPNCEKWYVNHEMSACYVNFPDVAKQMAELYNLPKKDSIIPGIFFRTSDSGDSSLTISGYWSINGHIVSGECFKRNHRGNVDLNKFVKDSGNQIFSKFTKVPERLCELLQIDTPNPKQTLKSVFKQLGAVKLLGITRSNILYKAICSEFISGRKYTAYDVALSISTLPDRCVGISKSFVEKLEQFANKAIFADYNTSTATEDEEETLILV